MDGAYRLEKGPAHSSMFRTAQGWPRPALFASWTARLIERTMLLRKCSRALYLLGAS